MAYKEVNTVTLPDKKERARIANIFFPSGVVSWEPGICCFTKIAFNHTCLCAWIAQSVAHSPTRDKVPGAIPGSANSAYEWYS